MNIQAKVALDKQEHPERFCPVARCLWKTTKLDHATQTRSVREDCPGGYCPRHQHLRPAKEWDLYWSPEGRKICRVEAQSEYEAIRKAPKPFSKYRGEIYAEEVKQ